jgi:pimeloyl-ACP methyl ester carboxylesterase
LAGQVWQMSIALAPPPGSFVARHVVSQDGLKLYYRDYGPRAADRLPLVCLPGLARTSADFDDVARAAAEHRHRPRRVIALDYRGRGRSDFDPNWQNYDLRIEIGDVMAVLTAAGIGEAIFLGTSRGGILTMLLGMMRGGAIKGAILNDIGGRIEGAGLARIKGYVGKMPVPRDLDEAVEILKRVAGAQFSGISAEEWRGFAERTWTMDKGHLRPDYDPNLSKPLEALDLEKPLPPLWPYFDCLKKLPVLSIRGENSDLFSAETQAEMRRRNPLCEAYIVAGQGHAPLLTDKAAIGKIIGFCAMVDDRA